MITNTERFWTKVDKTEGCWLWLGAKNSNGYGNFRHGGRVVKAHRYAHELLVGIIPAGLTIDHLCRVHNCINPAHLELVTHKVNILRGNGWAGLNARATHCPKGHAYDLLNTYNRGGKRYCRTCQRKSFHKRED